MYELRKYKNCSRHLLIYSGLVDRITPLNPTVILSHSTPYINNFDQIACESVYTGANLVSTLGAGDSFSSIRDLDPRNLHKPTFDGYNIPN